MTVDLIEIEEKAGYQDENWKAKMSEWVSGGKSSESSNVEVDVIGVGVGDEDRDEVIASTKDMYVSWLRPQTQSIEFFKWWKQVEEFSKVWRR